MKRLFVPKSLDLFDYFPFKQGFFAFLFLTLSGGFVFSQCKPPVATVACGTGNGPATNNMTINSGETYWFASGNTATFNGININGGRLIVCGNLTLSSITINNGGTIMVNPGATLTLNGGGTLNFNGNVLIYNFGTLNINSSITLQNANNLLMNASTSSVINMNSGAYNLNFVSSSSQFVNYGIASINTITVQQGPTPVVCLGLSSQLNLVNLSNTLANSFDAPAGPAYIRYTGNASLNSRLTNSSNVYVCQAPGATVSNVGATGGWGAANVSSNCSTSSAGLLPLSLISFTGNTSANVTRLNWSTASESGSDHFEIQRSVNGTLWQAIGKVQAAGYSSGVRNYQYEDGDVAGGIYYYRLKELDMNGKFTYSNSIRLSLEKAAVFSIWPNPGSSSIIHIQGVDLGAPASIEFQDLNGRTVFQSSLSSGKLTIPDLPKGMYLVRLTQGRTAQTSTIKYILQ